MLKRYNHLMVSLCFLWDIMMTSGAFLAAYSLRFQAGILPVLDPVVPSREDYLVALPILLLACSISYRACRLYEPRRVGTISRELFDIARATVFAILLFSASTFFIRREGFEYSRAVFLAFGVTNFFLLGATRFLMRTALRELRRKGRNLRHILIVGCGRVAQDLAEKIQESPWTGLQIVGFLDHSGERIGKSVAGHPIIGSEAEVADLVRHRRIDQVFIALPFKHYARAERIVDALSHEMVDVRIIPDFSRLATLQLRIDSFENLAVITIQESPLVGWHSMLKRTLDILISVVVLVLALPLMAVIAILIWLESRGPIFYLQERMGYDGATFRIFKFRTMRPHAEAESGAAWTTANDPRRTRIGAFLRKTSLDELPQFLNVIRGDMSIVGPRPERPVLIDSFRRSIPRYMLRHKIKAGITGWAQVNGWRGDTSLKKRVQYDLYYIRNWSIGFDIRIMLLTLVRGFVDRNAY